MFWTGIYSLYVLCGWKHYWWRQEGPIPSSRFTKLLYLDYLDHSLEIFLEQTHESLFDSDEKWVLSLS